MKIGFIATVLNEEKTIIPFLDSLMLQSRKPDEVVIVDGGSTDETISLIKKHKINKILKVKLFKKRGNISKGRNFAVKNCNSDIITMSDAGCILEKDWLKKIVKSFEKKDIDVVAGYYKGLTKNNFQKSLIPYVLVMPDKVNENFLPASRSMAIRKKAFEKIGGFLEKIDYGEDYDLVKRLKKSGAKIVLEEKAVVGWIPRENVFEAFRMFYRYAYGDVKAGNIRPKVIFIFARYFFALFTFLLARFISLNLIYLLLITYLGLYSGWSILKNYKYVRNTSALFYLPLIQIISDIAVISGTTISLLKKIISNLFTFIKKEKIVSISILVFTALLLSVINWGLPNSNHPFTYHMDEWHQLQAVRSVATNLSPISAGAAHGPMFFFIISGAYIGFLHLLGLVNPFLIEYSVGNLDIQNLLFIYLRLGTLLFALGAIFLLIVILKKFLKTKLLYIPLLLFIFSPNWIALSNYFKYDIAIVFWILFSILTLLNYSRKPTLKNYLIASIPVSLVAATKLSGFPMFAVYIFSFLLFTPKFREKISYVIKGSILYIVVFLLLGIPNILLGKADYYELLQSVVVDAPKETYNFNLGVPYYIYLFTNQVPTLFGYSLVVVFVFFLIYFLYKVAKLPLVKIIKEYKYELLVLFSTLIFSVSLYPLKLFIYNRALVVLPFIIIFIGLMLNRFMNRINNKKRFVIILTNFLLVIHVIQGFSWIVVKLNDPRQTSSEWILKKIEKGSSIGIEGPPIYQFLPDILVKEYYSIQKDKDYESIYNYDVISKSSNELPRYVIVTNKEIDWEYLYNSPKKDLLARMKKENYKELAVFEPNWWLSNYFTSRLDFFISLLAPTATITVYEDTDSYKGIND